MEIQTQIERFIIDDILSGSRPRIDPDEPLFSSGIIDSMGMLQLITFLEDQYDIVIGDGEVGEANIGTLSRLTAFVQAKSSHT